MGCDGGADAVAHEREIAHGVVAAREMHVESARASCLTHVGLFTRPKFGFDTTICQLCFFTSRFFERRGDPLPPP